MRSGWFVAHAGNVELRITTGSGHHHHPVTIEVADAYGLDYKVKADGSAKLPVAMVRSGGWYDLALTSPQDGSFRYELAGRLESSGHLTSDPQFSRT